MFPYFMWHCSIPYYQALVTGHVETVLLCRTVNFAMNKWQKLVSVACIDLASATFSVCVQDRQVQTLLHEEGNLFCRG